MRLAEMHGKQRECNARSGHEGQYEAWRTRAGAMVGVAACKQRVSHLTGQARPRRKSGEVFGCSGEVFGPGKKYIYIFRSPLRQAILLVLCEVYTQLLTKQGV